MKVSVIVPSHNRAHLLPRALASIAHQSHREIVVIVVDEASNDETDRVVHEIAASFPFLIRYFRQPSRGRAAARNQGLRVANGDAVAFLDPDGEWTRDAIAQLVDALETSGADFAFSPAIVVDEAGCETLERPAAAGHPERLACEHFEHANLHEGSMLFLRSAIESVGEFDESLRHHEDSNFHQRVAIHCRAAYVDAPSVRVFQNDERESANRTAILGALLASSQQVLANHPDFATNLGPRSDRRLDEIRALLLDALIFEGDFREARRLARTFDARRDPWQRIALAVGSARPYTLARRVRTAWQRWSEAKSAA